MTNEQDRVVHLDASLDTKNARIAYEEPARKALQGQNQTPATNTLEDNNQNETGSVYTPQEQVSDKAKDDQVEEAPKHHTALDNSKDDNHDPMGPSVLENIEISMVHVLPVEF
ncbi:hypothetical protein COP1_023208 [Malus domestica]